MTTLQLLVVKVVLTEAVMVVVVVVVVMVVVVVVVVVMVMGALGTRAGCRWLQWSCVVAPLSSCGFDKKPSIYQRRR